MKNIFFYYISSENGCDFCDFVLLDDNDRLLPCCGANINETDDWRKLTPETVVVILLPPADERQLDLSSGGRSETCVVAQPMVAHRSPTGAGCHLRHQGAGPATTVRAVPVDACDRLSGPHI